MRQLLETIDGDRLSALYSVALALGLRQGEALGLRWEDIDLDFFTFVQIGFRERQQIFYLKTEA